MERALLPAKRAKRNELDPRAIAAVLGATLTPAQRARAEALHRQVFAAAGKGSTHVEAALLSLLGPGSPTTAIDFWVETLTLTRSRDGFGPERKRQALGALVRIAKEDPSSGALAAIVAALEADAPVTRADALDALTELSPGRSALPAPALAAIERVARSDRDFLPRFRARRILEWLAQPPVVDEGTFTFAIVPKDAPGFRIVFELSADQFLFDLQRALHREIHWDQDHLWTFYLGKSSSSRRNDRVEIGLDEDCPFDPDRLFLGGLGLVVGQKFRYHFDFGDDHLFDVTVTAHEPEAKKRAKHPRLVERKGKPPQQDRW
jgi:hypothetical protein